MRIGRDPATGRLEVLVSADGKTKGVLVGEAGGVPPSVSRCVAGKGSAHLSIQVGGDGTLTAENLNPHNVTFVGGVEIISKKILPSDTLLLGKDKFPVSVKTILAVAEKAASAWRKLPPKAFDISPLEAVWDNYHDRNAEIQEKAKRQNLAGRLPLLFTMASGVISSLAFTCGWGEAVKGLCLVLTSVGLIVMLCAFRKLRNDTSFEDRERIREEFEDKYVCPNPECGKFLGYRSYRRVKKQDGCPYCKCKFTERHKT